MADKTYKSRHTGAEIDAGVDKITAAPANPVVDGSYIVIKNGQSTTYGPIVANPTLAGTEVNLTGLQIGEMKYAVPSVPHLYRHDIMLFPLYSGNNQVVSFTLYNNISTSFTIDEVFSEVYMNYKIDDHRYISATGYRLANASSYILFGICGITNTEIYGAMQNIGANVGTSLSFVSIKKDSHQHVDTVTQIF